MRKLTSRRFRKCGSFWASEFLNGSYRCSKLTDCEILGPLPKIQHCKKTLQELRMLSSVTIKCEINKDCHKSRLSLVSIVISVSNVTSPYDCSFRVFSNVFVFVIFFGHVMSSYHSEQMSQRSQVSRIALRGCSQNVFVFVFVIVIVIQRQRQ